MSVWRRKAIECLPKFRQEFEQPDVNIYTIFIEMLPELVLAHQKNDHEQMKKIYDFAEWCSIQKEKDLWNAAGVSFYEHLGDYPETLKEFTRRIKPSIYKEVKGLLEERLSPEEFTKLEAYYNNFRTR